MRRIALVSVGRSDYGIYLPLLRAIQADASLELSLIAGGMHLSPEFGLTVRTIEADGFEVSERVEMLLSSDTPEGIAKSMGLGVMGFAQAYSRLRPDIIVVLGDRFEMHAAALAALPFRIPVAHLHGGELTQGAIDDSLRHSMTKLSHLHFASTQEYADRIVQLGEEPWRVTICGALSLDNVGAGGWGLGAMVEDSPALSPQPSTPPLMVTFHPVTLEYEQAEWQAGELLAALDEIAMPVIFSMPNADTNGRVIIRMIERFVETHPSARLVDNLGTQAYFSLMSRAAAMVGNSSSGIIEAPAFRLPVVNIGTRQQGRIRAANVIDVGYSRAEIVEGIRRAISPDFRTSLEHMINPYYCGGAAYRIIECLKSVPLDDRLITKRFYDMPIRSLEKQV